MSYLNGPFGYPVVVEIGGASAVIASWNGAGYDVRSVPEIRCETECLCRYGPFAEAARESLQALKPGRAATVVELGIPIFGTRDDEAIEELRDETGIWFYYRCQNGFERFVAESL